MNKSYLIEALKDRYEHEQFRRNNFDNVINLPITILGLLIGGFSAFAFQNEQSWGFLKIGALTCVGTIGFSIFFLIRVFYGTQRKYAVLPTAQIIKEQHEKLITYHRELASSCSDDDLQKQIEISFNDDLIKWYADSCDVNCDINDSRAEFLHKSKFWLILSLILIFILVTYKISFV